jgi:hypothetical protein
MIIVVSGEGPTDIGRCDNGAGICDPPDYVLGAMGRFVDALVEPIWTYSPYDARTMHFVTEGTLARLSDDAKIVTLPGKKKEQETGYFFKNAYALGTYAAGIEEENECETMAVLFRDADGTRSTQRGLWEGKVKSMNLGFVAAGYPRGVPMVPKPKSEAWLLCAVQKHPYQNCIQFESISGNDRSPNNAKKQLEEALAPMEKTHLDVPDMIGEASISPASIDMPSFNVFRERLEQIARKMIGQ